MTLVFGWMSFSRAATSWSQPLSKVRRHSLTCAPVLRASSRSRSSLMVRDSASELESRYLAVNSYLPKYCSIRKGLICMRRSLASGRGSVQRQFDTSWLRLRSEASQQVQIGWLAGYDTGIEVPNTTRCPEGPSMAHRFTIGVEEEFQIIDPATCELRSHVSQIVSEVSADIAEQG